MSVDPHTARPNDRVVEVIRMMASKQVRRIPVVNENGYLLGMISMGDIALETHEDRELADALAGARLPHDAERLPGKDVVGNAVDGVDDPVFGRELDHEVADREDRLRHAFGAGSGRGRREARHR